MQNKLLSHTGCLAYELEHACSACVCVYTDIYHSASLPKKLFPQAISQSLVNTILHVYIHQCQTQTLGQIMYLLGYKHPTHKNMQINSLTMPLPFVPRALL